MVRKDGDVWFVRMIEQIEDGHQHEHEIWILIHLMFVHDDMSAADCIESPQELSVAQVGLVLDVWRPLSLRQLLMKCLVVCMGVLIGRPQVLGVNLVQYKLVPENDVALLALGRQDLEVALEKRITEALRWGRRLKLLLSVDHQELLRQEQMLVQAVAMDLGASLWEKALTNSLSVISYFFDQLVIVIRCVSRSLLIINKLRANKTHIRRNFQNNSALIHLLNALEAIARVVAGLVKGEVVELDGLLDLKVGQGLGLVACF